MVQMDLVEDFDMGGDAGEFFYDHGGDVFGLKVKEGDDIFGGEVFGVGVGNWILPRQEVFYF